MRVLITGGAGAIGSNLSDVLLRISCSVRVRDSLAPQINGFERHRPSYLADDAELARKRQPNRARRAGQAQGARKPTFGAEHNAQQSMGGTICADRRLV